MRTFTHKLGAYKLIFWIINIFFYDFFIHSWYIPENQEKQSFEWHIKKENVTLES